MKVIKTSNLPTKPPVLLTVVTLVALDHWHAGDVTRGVFYALLVILWIAAIVLLFKEDQTDIFKEK
jgi:hypothetical protein